jgi:CubicO group peptidase (beta-lactamase class C family)
MERTTTSVAELGENVALPHNASASPRGSKELRSFAHGNVDNCWGACGINSSVNDLSRWLRLQLGRGTFEGKTIFSKNQSWEMWQPNVVIPVSEAASQINPTRHFVGYGLGWVLYDYHGVKVVNHSGGLDGMISQTAIVPEKNFAVVVLTNSESPVATLLRDRILDDALDATPRDWNIEALDRRAKADADAAERDRKIDAARVEGTQMTLALERYAGTYSCPMYGDATVAVEDGHLVLRLVPAANFVADLEHWHYDTFVIRWRDTVRYNFPRGFATFSIDATPQAAHLTLDQPNDDFWFYELDLKRK